MAPLCRGSCHTVRCDGGGVRYRHGKCYRSIVSYKVQPYTPSVTSGDTSPYTGEANATLFLRMKVERAGHAAAPTLKNGSPYRPSSGTFGATSL